MCPYSHTKPLKQRLNGVIIRVLCTELPVCHVVQLSGKAVLVENNRDHDLAVGRQHPLNAVPQLKAAVVALVEVFLEYDYHSTAPVDGVLDVLQDWIPGRKVPVAAPAVD